MHKILLVDSDILIDWMHQRPKALKFIDATPGLSVPSFCLLELLEGCRDRRAQEATLKKLRAFNVYYPSSQALQLAEEIFSKHRLSKGICSMDALIAGTVIEAEGKLFTRNSKHFKGLGVAYETPYTAHDESGPKPGA